MDKEQDSHLFIGGPVDGETIAVTDVERVNIPTSDFGAFVYKRQTFTTQTKSYDLFIPEDWTPEEAIEHLLKNYSDMKATLDSALE